MCWNVGTRESDERLGGVEEMYDVHTETFCEEVMPKTYLKPQEVLGGLGYVTC